MSALVFAIGFAVGSGWVLLVWSMCFVASRADDDKGL